MSKTRIAINGMGRIGRTVFRQWLKNNQNVEIVAVNNPGKSEQYLHLLQYDSVHGVLASEVKQDGNRFTVDNNSVRFFNHQDPAEIPWEEEAVDIVIDGTGIFKDKKALSKHLRGSVRKVVMCAPGNDLDGTFVFGINHEDYQPENHHIVSNASCTTNCLAPVAKVLNDRFEIKQGFMTTIHAYTLDQALLDTSHNDLRRARAANLSMIPTTTGAAKAVGLVIPELKGKLDGYAIRVPTPDVSMVDLTVNLVKNVTKEEVNLALKEAANSYLKGILLYTEKPLVSIDYTGTSESSVVDAPLTNVVGEATKVVAWYDNEAGFSARVLDLTNYIAERL